MSPAWAQPFRYKLWPAAYHGSILRHALSRRGPYSVPPLLRY